MPGGLPGDSYNLAGLSPRYLSVPGRYLPFTVSCSRLPNRSPPTLPPSHALSPAGSLPPAPAPPMPPRLPPPPRAWQRMLSGRRLDLLDPSPLDVEIEDIAHGLARVARWNGQTHGEHGFSVAQHCVLVEELALRLEPILAPKWRLVVLLHDAPEYVIGDMISPFKAVVGGGYKAVEHRLETAIHLRFGLPATIPAMIRTLTKRADHISAYFEAGRARRLRGQGGGEAVRARRKGSPSGSGSPPGRSARRRRASWSASTRSTPPRAGDGEPAAHRSTAAVYDQRHCFGTMTGDTGRVILQLAPSHGIAPCRPSTSVPCRASTRRWSGWGHRISPV